MELLPEALTLNSVFGMSTSANLSSNIFEAAKVAAVKSDFRQALGRCGESAGQMLRMSYQCSTAVGRHWSTSMTRAQTGSNNSALRTTGCAPTVCGWQPLVRR